jgi:hypothetical protein
VPQSIQVKTIAELEAEVIIEALNKFAVEYVVIGAFAAIAHLTDWCSQPSQNAQE